MSIYKQSLFVSQTNMFVKQICFYEQHILEDSKIIFFFFKMLNSTGFHLYIAAFAILATGQFRRNSFPVMHCILWEVVWDKRWYINSKALWRINATLLLKSHTLGGFSLFITWHMSLKLTQLLAVHVASGLLLEYLYYSFWELAGCWNTVNEVLYFIPLP